MYQKALAREFAERRIPFQAEVPFTFPFKGQGLRTRYRADFLCYGQVLVELKALRTLSGIETAQILNYLRASGLERALLLNFGAPSLEYRRLVFTQPERA